MPDKATLGAAPAVFHYVTTDRLELMSMAVWPDGGVVRSVVRWVDPAGTRANLENTKTAFEHQVRDPCFAAGATAARA